ncbi:hypothetical protein AUP68_01696 [Ilyonectria robusta]
MSHEELLLEWYSAQQTIKVDIVGDFAGGEPFAIHGESLIKYCLEQSRVDFDGGFQLLHAVYAVESFLNDLQKRGCNFDIFFFRDLDDVCVPEGAAAADAYKYHLTRAILIQHLARSDIRSEVHEFDSFESDSFTEFLSTHSLQFILCHEGDGDEGSRTVQLRHLIWKFASRGRHVGIFNFIAWETSKVFVHLLSGTQVSTGMLEIKTPSRQPSESSTEKESIIDEYLEPDSDSELTLREWFAVNFCSGVLENLSSDEIPKDTLDELHALLLHMAALRVCSLQNRRCEATSGDFEAKPFLRLFSEVSQSLAASESEDCELTWDLFDLIDGRVFSFMLKKVKTNSPVPAEIMEAACSLWKEVTQIQSAYAKPEFDIAQRPSAPSSPPTGSEKKTPAILAFDHPAFSKFLENIKVDEAQETINPAANIVFEDLKHWHNNKSNNTSKPVVPFNKNPAPLGFFARKRKQHQMSEIITYAASLQSAAGKMLDPETIIVGARHTPSSVSKPGKPPAKETQKKGGKQSANKGGKEKALKAAQEIQDRKIRAKRDDVIRFWAEKCAEFETDPSMISRYLKADKFLATRSRNDHGSLSPEVRLYLCQILGKIWLKTRENVREMSLEGLYLISMMWHSLQGISWSGTCTPEIANAVQGITTSLRMPHLDVSVGEPARKLSFLIDVQAAKHAAKLVRDYRILQLEHGGPYMERRFDSKPDPRVPFEPDAWQRKVLDSIDANENLLVVAPTSAGKTFISFYAMKKVLEENDDAVLVYVAPTKALVNQIAAEVEARFSKSYHNKAGKSVWAIHTRDYRINNPSGCQVLVTVPDVLQTMLLSPSNAAQPTSWSRRVKRIIFDEVHCIGQAEDGVIWEQLLLLAPCPIIALSATVGNPNEFRDWLRVARGKKGSDMTMVVHDVRYSDLRKFIYQPPPGEFTFGELAKTPRLPVPGLDEGNAISPNFKFVHPVVALKDHNRAALDDLTLEARDCLTLWEKMKEHLSPDLMSKYDALDPKKVLPHIVSKSDIVGWEKGLKAALRQVMEASDSSLKTLQTSLDPTGQQNGALKSTETTEKYIEQPFQEVDHVVSLFSLVCELHSQDALPALAFNYDRMECERAVAYMAEKMEEREQEWKDGDAAWNKKVQDFKQWEKLMADQRESKAGARVKDAAGDASKVSKLDLARDEGSADISQWKSFDINAPLDPYSFADTTKVQKSEFDQMVRTLRREKVTPLLMKALERGLGVHHAGMNRRYRQIVVVATGTLALGVNMPCKTVIFSGDSVFLNTQNYRQASGRAGRRGFDLLGNIVFNGIPHERVYEIMASRLPDLKGQFPISTTLILRLFGLLDGTKNSEFAMDSVKALLSQNKLYLGGPDADLSVRHHVRFSIEYLRRQNLLSASGAPLNFADLVGHLYFTDNSVFAFHSLLRGGYFHKLCADIEKDPKNVLFEMMLVLSHLFSRIPVRRVKESNDKIRKAPSVILPKLPEAAETMLVQHNGETLSIFKDCVHSYINQYLGDKPDRTMPFTQTAVGLSEATGGASLGCEGTTIRSPFVSLSGFGDDFDTVQDLCSTVRGDVFLEESLIPQIQIWPNDTSTDLNSYILDFYKHGSLEDLVRENRIKVGDVWFFLKDFSMTLKAIISSLKNLIGLETSGDDDSDGSDESDTEELGGKQEAAKPVAAKEKKEDPAKKKKKAKVLDSWDDGSSESESEPAWDDSDEEDSTPPPSSAQSSLGGGLLNVLKAFELLQEDYEAKFMKIGA